MAVWLDGALYFCTGDTGQKAVNLAASPHVILTTGCNRSDAGLNVVFEGDAVQVTEATCSGGWPRRGRPSGTGDGSSGPRQFFRHMEGLRVPVFAVRPAKVLAFAKGEVFSHTSHRF